MNYQDGIDLAFDDHDFQYARHSTYQKPRTKKTGTRLWTESSTTKPATKRTIKLLK